MMTQDAGPQICYRYPNFADANVNADGVSGFRHQAQGATRATSPAATLQHLCAFFNDNTLFKKFGNQIGDGGGGETGQSCQIDARHVLMTEQGQQYRPHIV